MENYSDFYTRIELINRNSVLSKEFNTNKSLEFKVNDSQFIPFYGDTTVFMINDSIKNKLETITEELYKNTSGYFSEKLDPSTFHITLHDLCNNNDYFNIRDEMTSNESKLLSLIDSEGIQDDKIRFVSGKIINMVNTSLVYTVIPKNEHEYKKIANLYELVDKVKELPYFFTPHITLYYFSTRNKNENERKILNKYNSEKFEFEVYISDLFYQRFTDMKSYISIFPFIK